MDKKEVNRAGNDLDNDISVLKELINNIQKKYSLSCEEIFNLAQKEPEQILIPVSVLNTDFPPLESITKYLKETLGLNLRKISTLLNRDETTIWTTYNNSKKRAKRFVLEKSKFFIPVDKFADENLSILEGVSEYLHEVHKLTYHNIATLLKRNDRTIWTVCSRAKKKREHERKHEQKD